jgi:pimeloyl-ACP methyl ester carboxylesterase
MNRDRTHQVLRLRDGRALGFAEHGDVAGEALFFFHGAPGSRVLLRAQDAAACRHVRVILPERPGYGLSTFKPDRTLLDWVADVVELADALGIERFAVAGTSGGAPYAEAIAAKLPERVTRLGIVAGVAPLHAARGNDAEVPLFRRLAMAAARKSTKTVRVLAKIEAMRVEKLLRGSTERVLEELIARSPESDRAILAEPGSFAMYRDSYWESWRQGRAGYARDLELLASPWGFDLGEIRVPTWLWHGEDDRVTPLYMGEHVARSIAGCKATIVRHGGHLLRLPLWGDIVRTLTPTP